MNIIRTRFAPSPTGALHLGTARTAYFSWLYARKNNGRFELRIEDTDAQRNQDPTELLEVIKWLGFDYDKISYQSHRVKRHVDIVRQLEVLGFTYKCDISSDDKIKFGSAIRFKMPKDKIILNDKVQGQIVTDGKDLDDVVLLRSNGTPTYIIASLVDDYDDGITHVIRGADHLTNTFKQIAIYNALGWSIPTFAHIPLVTDLDGQKLSKRRGAKSIMELKSEGYLPEAICNTIIRMGWSYKDEEIVPHNRALELFDLCDLNPSPACYDPAKLDHLNGYYIRNIDIDKLWQLVMPFMQGWSEIELRRARFLLLETSKRSVTLKCISESLVYCRDNFQANGILGLCGLKDVLENSDFTEHNLDLELRKFAMENNFNFGKEIAQPIRFALTGQNTSPSLFHVMEGLGKDICLKRLFK